MGATWERKHSLIMLQVLFLASLAAAVPAPEADPLLYTGHPLTYSVPYVTYHAPVCETEFEEVKGQSCVTKPVTECKDVEVPSHKIVTENVCQNVTTAECTGHAGVYYGKREADPQVLWCRPCCPPLPQLRQQGHRGVLPSPEGRANHHHQGTCSHAEHTKPAGEAVETE